MYLSASVPEAHSGAEIVLLAKSGMDQMEKCGLLELWDLHHSILAELSDPSEEPLCFEKESWSRETEPLSGFQRVIEVIMRASRRRTEEKVENDVAWAGGQRAKRL